MTMTDLVSKVSFLGALISILAYLIGLLIQKKTKLSVLSPFIVAVFLVIAFLLFFQVDYEIYNQSAKFLNYLLTPATVCLAIPLYQRLALLKREWKAVLVGIFSGVLANGLGIFVFAHLFRLSHTEYVTLLPKSVTTAISIGISTELGGLITISVAATIITGLSGNMLGPFLCRLFRIHNPVAQGLALGTASHAIGTARAMEMGRTQGAISGLSIALTGLITVLLAPLFARLL